jgi:hypothetical protein
MSRLKWLKFVVPIVVVAATIVSVVLVNEAEGSAPPPYLSYAVKFTCGEFGKLIPGSASDVPEGPVKPGDYQTAINVHNPSAGLAISFAKKAVLMYSGTKPIPETAFERPIAPGALKTAQLGPDFGMLIDCQDIRAVLLPSPAAPAAPTFIEGYVIIQEPFPATGTPPPPLDVTALYTSHGYNCTVPAGATTCSSSSVTRQGFSEDLQTINPITVRQ